jgi:hypothetical protein
MTQTFTHNKPSHHYKNFFIEESDVVRLLKENVRILCWIMSGPNNTNKAVAVNSTWASRCNKHVFITASKVREISKA